MNYTDPDLKKISIMLKKCFKCSLKQALNNKQYNELRKLVFYWLFQNTKKTTKQIANLCNTSNNIVIGDIKLARRWANTNNAFKFKIEEFGNIQINHNEELIDIHMFFDEQTIFSSNLPKEKRQYTYDDLISFAKTYNKSLKN